VPQTHNNTLGPILLH